MYLSIDIMVISHFMELSNVTGDEGWMKLGLSIKKATSYKC